MQYFKFKRGTLKFFLFVFMVLVSCNTSKDNKIIDFDLEKRISLPLPQEVINSDRYLYTYPYTVKFIENEQKLLVKFYWFNSLYIYDINTKAIVNKIPFSETFDFDNVLYINPDSILLFLSGVYKYYYDTSIVVINSKGEVKKSYGIEHPEVLSSSTISMYSEEEMYNCLFPMFYGKDICYKNNVYFVLNISQERFLENNFVPVLGFYDFKQNKANILNNVTYPINKPISVFNYPENIFKMQYDIIPSKDELWLSFSFSPTAYKLDLKTNKGNFVVLNSKLPDTSWVYEEGKMGHIYQYARIAYINSLQKYIRRTAFVINEERFYSWATYDKQFNYIGEVIKKTPIDVYNDKFFYPDIIHDSLVINFYKPKEIPFDAQKFEQELKKMPKPEPKNESCNFIQNNSNGSHAILDYFKMKNLKSDSLYSVLILNDKGCPSCNEYFIKFLKFNSFLLNKKKNPFYCIYIANNKETIENYLKKNKLENIIVDESKNYNTYHPYKYFNPRLVLVKNNKIVSDTIYMPDKLENLVVRLTDFYGYTTE